MRDPLVAPLAAIAAGILVSRFVPFEIRELLTVITALFLLALLSLWRSTRVLAACCCLLALLLSGALLEVVHRPGPPPELDAGSHEVVILSGCVVEPPVLFDNREQFVLELARRARARVNLNLREGEQLPALRYGQRVELEARVRRPHNFGNPGSFDYEGYLARQHIYWTASVPAGAPIRTLPGDCGSRFWSAIFGVRVRALERLEWLYQGKPYETGMMQAILIGESSKVEKVWTEHFRSTGTYHALVISGLHVTVLAASFLFILRLCFLSEETALMLATLAAWLYALVSGWQAPVLRAAAGLTLFLVGRYFYRQRRLLNLLAAVAIAFLIFDPEQMFEASFQLSFLSVAAIAVFGVPLIEGTSLHYSRGLGGLSDRDRDLNLLPRVAQFRVELRLLAETVSLWTRIPERFLFVAQAVSLRLVFYVYELVVISAVVQIGLALPMAAYFHRISFSGLSANVMVVPLMSIVVPVGFVAIFTGWSLPAILANWLLMASQKVVDWHAQWEPSWRVPEPPLWLAVSFTASLILLALVARAPRRWRWAAALSALALFAVLVWHPFAPKIELGALELTAIDVGQGDSLLVAFPDGKLMVMDGGGNPAFGRPSRSRLDPGEDVVSPYLWSRSIRRLDVVALSHAHEDHIGGMAALIDNFRPRELWTGATPETPAWRALRDKALRLGVRIVPIAGGRRFDYGGVRVEALSPPADYVLSETPRNNDSLALRLSFGAHSLLLTGDIEREMESVLVDKNLLEKTDVLKVAHHGSKTSSGASFLGATHPGFAIISAGFENPYNHPHPDVVSRLEQQHAALFRTDLWGMVSIRTDGRRFHVETPRWSGKPRGLYRPF